MRNKHLTLKTALDGLSIHNVYSQDPVSSSNSYDIGLCRITENEDGSVTLYVRRPGLLIGRGGDNLNKLEEQCGFPIKVKEFCPFATDDGKEQY